MSGRPDPRLRATLKDGRSVRLVAVHAGAGENPDWIEFMVEVEFTDFMGRTDRTKAYYRFKPKFSGGPLVPA